MIKLKQFMQILAYPNDILRQKTKAVSEVTPELVEIANQMYKVMRGSNGIGLAAPQVGLEISLIVLENDGESLALFNPVILDKSGPQEYGNEGCLSFIGIIRNIKRPKQVKVKFRNIHNKMEYKVLTGLKARCLIHEWEHLLGRLFIDHDEKK